MPSNLSNWRPGCEIKAIRFGENPIIRREMLPGEDGVNINGPSLIRTPDWLPGRLGKYYLYFANHGGKYIRLAYADDLHGPWTVYEPGTLQLSQTPDELTNDQGHGHIASPDMHIDEKSRQILMYYHGVVFNETGKPMAQRTFLARSSDGLHFESDHVDLGPSYFRVFRYGQYYYAISNGGDLLRSLDGVSEFEQGSRLLHWDDHKGRARHSAVLVLGDHAWVFYSRIGDSPERIQFCEVKLHDDWTKWELGPVVELLQPELEYEGVELPIETSVSGYAKDPVHQLRDPAIYVENGKVYLFYSTAGEHGLAIAELVAE